MGPTPVIAYEQLVADLTEAIKRAKAQTGDLDNAKKQIDGIDRALRGSNGEKGLFTRIELMEEALTRLAREQIPEVLEAVKCVIADVGSVRNEVGVVKGDLAAHKVQTENAIGALRTHVDNSISDLRKDYEDHLKDEEEADKREQNDKAKFGGAEWFRQNASAILVAVIQLIITSSVTVYILSRFIPPTP